MYVRGRTDFQSLQKYIQQIWRYTLHHQSRTVCDANGTTPSLVLRARQIYLLEKKLTGASLSSSGNDGS